MPGLAAALLFFAAAFSLRGEERRRLSDKGFFALIAGIYVLLLAVQLFVGYHIAFIAGWDAGVLIDTAKNIVEQDDSHLQQTMRYFEMYPNNLPLLCILTALYRLGAAVFWRPYAVAAAVSVGSVWLSLLLATLCVYKLTGSRRTTLLSTAISAVLIGLSPWIVVPYSDSIGMIFPTAALFCILYCRRPTVGCFLAAFLAMFGRFIKPTALIFLIALVILALCRLPEHRREPKRLLATAAALALGIAAAFALRGLILSTGELRPEPEGEFGISHFFMMGANPDTNGIYSDEDVAFSESFPTKQARRQADIDRAAQRLRDMGVGGYVKLLAQKTIQNYNDGSFGWGREGGFYYMVPESWSAVSNALRSLFYDTGENWQYLGILQQTLWFLVLIGCMFSALPMGRGERGQALIALTLLGLSLFLLLFECRARYLYVYAPFFAVLSACGMQSAALRIRKRNTA